MFDFPARPVTFYQRGLSFENKHVSPTSPTRKIIHITSEEGLLEYSLRSVKEPLRHINSAE